MGETMWFTMWFSVKVKRKGNENVNQSPEAVNQP